MDSELKREIIMEHYQNPINRKIINDESYEKVNTANESCIDNIDMYILIKDNIIKDICFDGEACAISISSTSIMIKNLIGKSVSEAKDYINNFINMVNEKMYDKDMLKEAFVYEDIYKQSSRKTCATLPYRGILKVLENYE